MKKYRKGCIISGAGVNNSDEVINFYFSDNGNVIDYRNNSFYSLFNELNKNSQKYICKLLMDRIKNINRDDTNIVFAQKQLAGILKQLFHHEIEKPISHFSIIYEEVTDVDGNLYGKEILTGILFPIAKFDYRYLYRLSDDTFFEFLVGNKVEPQYFYKATNHKIYTFNVCRNLEVYHDNLKEGNNYLVKENGVAFEYDIDDYKKRYVGFLGSYRLKEWNKKLLNISAHNTYLSDVILKDDTVNQDKVLLEQDNLSKHMEAVEYLLMRLKLVNIELYHQYKEQYAQILKDSDDLLNVGTFILNKLVNLEANIEFNLYFLSMMNGENILISLEKIKKDYFENIFDGHERKMNISIKDLDKISELFLNVGEKYSLVDRRKILKNIAFLYLLDVYVNRDIIDIDDLENSYFKNNLKSIAIYIESLRELDMIDHSIYIDLENEPTLENIFNIIKNMNFNFHQKDAKKLMKELSI